MALVRGALSNTLISGASYRGILSSKALTPSRSPVALNNLLHTTSGRHVANPLHLGVRRILTTAPPSVAQTKHISTRSPAARILASQAAPRIALMSTSAFNQVNSVSLMQQRGFAAGRDNDALRREICLMIDKEVQQLRNESVGALEEPPKEWLEENGFKVETTESEVTLIKTGDKEDVTIKFNIPGDEEKKEAAAWREQGMGANPEEEGVGGAEGEAEADPEAGDVEPALAVDITLTVRNKKGDTETIFAEGSIDPYEHLLQIYSVKFNREQHKSIWIEDLSDDLQHKIYEYFDNLGLDSVAVSHMFTYVRGLEKDQDARNLASLKKLLSGHFKH